MAEHANRPDSARGANDAKRRHARWQLHDTFRKELVERFNHISAKLDQAKKPEILRDKAVRKREEYALRQIQSEGSIRGAGNWSELSLTQPSALSLRSYVLPSVRTGPVIADADRHRVVPVSEVKIERVEMNRLININVHRTARTLVEESLTDRRDALMEEACQLFGSRLSLYRSFGIRDRERRIVNKLQRLVENALVQRVEVELERLREGARGEPVILDEARNRVLKELQDYMGVGPTSSRGHHTHPAVASQHGGGQPLTRAHAAEATATAAAAQQSPGQRAAKAGPAGGARRGSAAGIAPGMAPTANAAGADAKLSKVRGSFLALEAFRTSMESEGLVAGNSMRRGSNARGGRGGGAGVHFGQGEGEGGGVGVGGKMGAGEVGQEVGGKARGSGLAGVADAARGKGAGEGEGAGGAGVAMGVAVGAEEGPEAVLSREVQELVEKHGGPREGVAWRGLAGILAYEKQSTTHRLEPSGAESGSQGASELARLNREAMQRIEGKEEGQGRGEAKRFTMDAPLQSLMEDSCFYFLPGIRSKLIGGPSALKAVVAKALGDSLTTKSGSLTRGSPPRFKGGNAMEVSVANAVREFVVMGRDTGLDTFSLSIAQQLNLDRCDLSVALQRSTKALRNIGTCLSNMPACKAVSLRYNFLKVRHISDILTAIRTHCPASPALNALDLSWNEVGAPASLAPVPSIVRRGRSKESGWPTMARESYAGSLVSEDSFTGRLTRAQQEARRAAKKMLERHNSFKEGLAQGGIATSELLATDLRSGTVNDADLRELMGGSKQGPGQGAKLGDFAWVDTVMVEVDRRGLPAAMARKGRVPRATVQVAPELDLDEATASPAPAMCAISAFLVREAVLFPTLAAPGDPFVGWMGVTESRAVRLVGLRALVELGWLQDESPIVDDDDDDNSRIDRNNYTTNNHEDRPGAADGASRGTRGNAGSVREGDGGDEMRSVAGSERSRGGGGESQSVAGSEAGKRGGWEAARGAAGLDAGGWGAVARSVGGAMGRKKKKEPFVLGKDGKLPAIVGDLFDVADLDPGELPLSTYGHVDGAGLWHPEMKAGLVELPGGRISQLVLEGNEIQDTATLGLLGVTVAHCRGLRELSLSNNLIATAGVGALCNGLRFAPHLRALDLSFNDLDARSVEELALIMPALRGLQALDLSWNVLGDEGVSCVAAALPDALAMTELHLNSVGCSDEAAICLSEALRESPGLPMQLLGLDGNVFTNEGMQALTEAVKQRGTTLSVIAPGLNNAVFHDCEGKPVGTAAS